MSHYQHLTTEEREKTMIAFASGASSRAIARELGRSPSTIAREKKRNQTKLGKYSAIHAEKLYFKRKKNCGRTPILADCKVSEYVTEHLMLQWSPEQIAARAKLDNKPFSISPVTIYRAIDRKILPSQLKKELRIKSGYKKHKTNDKRSQMQGITKIKDRPASVEKRKTIGHWEADTVLGQRKTGSIGTFVERKSGYMITFLLERRSSEEFNLRAAESFTEIPKKYRRSLTVDRGKEFTNHKELASIIDAPVYFCDPYSPWQRGSNENTNGLLRQYYPKRTSFLGISEEDLANTTRLINQRPRKRLGWLTPEEVFLKNFFR